MRNSRPILEHGIRLDVDREPPHEFAHPQSKRLAGPGLSAVPVEWQRQQQWGVSVGVDIQPLVLSSTVPSLQPLTSSDISLGDAFRETPRIRLTSTIATV